MRWLISGRVKVAVILFSIVPLALKAQIPEGYYDLALGSSGAALKSALHDIVSDHIQYPYTSSSTDVWDILKASDEDPDNPNNVILIYTGRSQAKTENSGESNASGANRWNREHVWSKSHGFPNESDTAFTDCHHLRPADESVNSSRSTLDFDNGGVQHVEATDGFYDSDSWEARDAVKGDIARMMFYMVIRYDPGYHTDNSIYDLELVDHTGTVTYQPTFGKLSTLLQWHHQDPVDSFEQNRNEIVFGYQANRNPFIDHPEWADSIFARQLSSNTRIEFTNTSVALNEDAGSFQLEVSIINPDPIFSTHCEIQLSSGDGSDLGEYQSQALTFPAASSTVQTLDIFITDDDLIEEQETFLFNILNVSGGDSAEIGGNNTFVLTLNPSDQQSAVLGLIISEVMDGNRAGGQPKYVEITNTTDESIDISGFQIWRGSNGGDPGLEVSIPTGISLDGGRSWVIASNSGDMLSAGFSSPSQTAWGINGNGNDVYQLRSATGEYIDAFGLAGTATPWYEDALAERVRTVTGSRGAYDPLEWTITGLGADSPANGSPGTPGTHVFDPVVSIQPATPQDNLLLSAYPNPFNPSTSIQFTLPEDGELSLVIYDIQGRKITDLLHARYARGSHSVSWRGNTNSGVQVNTGIYFARLVTAENTRTIKLLYLR